jgi:hypothetical protein
MSFDDNIDEDSSEDLENEVDSQESNIDEVVFTDDINSKLEEALESFRLCQ